MNPNIIITENSWIPFLNLKLECTKTPNEPNDENELLNVIGKVYGLTIDVVRLTDSDRFDTDVHESPIL